MFYVLMSLVLLSGCAINRATADRDPSFDPAKIKSFHVLKHGKDGRDINVLIANRIREMGYPVTTGTSPAFDSDAIVTYEDRW